MGAMIPITCPECKKTLQGPRELAGKKIRCKSCNHPFVVKMAAAAAGQAATAPPSKGAPAPPPAPKLKFDEDEGPPTYSFMDEEKNQELLRAKPPPLAPTSVPGGNWQESDANPYGLSGQGDTAARCPFCAAEMAGAEAIICLNCGYNTQTREYGKTRRTYDTTPHEQFMWLLPGILAIVGIVALIGFDFWFWLGPPFIDVWDWMDENWGSTSFSQGVRTWVVIMTAFVMWFAGLFAYNRLVKNPVCPEQDRK